MTPAISVNYNSKNFFLHQLYTIKSSLQSIIHRIAALAHQLFESIKNVIPSIFNKTKEIKATPEINPEGNLAAEVEATAGRIDNSPIPPATKPEPISATDELIKSRQELAARIAREKIALNSLNLSQPEMLALAPYLTYLSLIFPNNAIVPKTITDDFVGELLEKTEQLNHLKINHCKMYGSYFERFINVGHLKTLEIVDTRFSCPLPEGMGALQELVISSNLYNQPFPKGLGDLQKLELIACYDYNQSFPERMDALKTLNINMCSKLTRPLPSRMDALENLTYPIRPNSRNKDALLKALLEIYQVDRARGVRLASSYFDEHTLISHLLFGKDPDNKELQKWIKFLPAQALRDLSQRKDIPYVHDDILKEDTLQQLYIYVICSNLPKEQMDLLKQFLGLITKTPIDENLKKIYQELLKYDGEYLTSFFQYVVAENDLLDLDIETRMQFLSYLLLWPSERGMILKNLRNLKGSGLFTAFHKNFPADTKECVPHVVLAGTLAGQELFTGDSETDRHTFFGMLVEKINRQKIPIATLKLSEDEMLELAPRLTYLDLTNIDHQIAEGNVDSFIGKLLEKTERLKFLRIKFSKFDGSAFGSFKKVRKLKTLEISNCVHFNHPLPKRMAALKQLEIDHCPLYNQPLPEKILALRRLVIACCYAYNQPFPVKLGILGFLDLTDCISFNQPLTIVNEAMHTLKFNGCHSLKFHHKFHSLFITYKFNKEKAVKLATSMGIEEVILKGFSPHFSEVHEPDLNTCYQILANILAEHKMPLPRLRAWFSVADMYELAPHLTYLNFTHDGHLDAGIMTDDFFGNILEKTEQLEHLVLKNGVINGSAFAQFKNVGHLKSLTIENCKNLNAPLPTGMSALQTLCINNCENYNQPLPQDMNALRRLHIVGCNTYNATLPEGLTTLKELSFANSLWYNRPLPRDMRALESIDITTTGLNPIHLLPAIHSIYEFDKDRAIKLALAISWKVYELLRLYITLFETDDEVTIALCITSFSGTTLPFPQHSLNRIAEFIKRQTGRKFLQENRKEFFNHPQLRDLLFSVYPPHKQKHFALYNEVKLVNNVLLLTLQHNAALDFPDFLFAEIKKHLVGPQRVKGLDVKFHGSPGIDGGGLRRQFVAQLLPQLLTRSKMFKFSATENGKVIPQATLTLTDDDLENYRALGKFLGIAYRQKIPIGEVFSEKWLRFIHSFTDKDLDQDIDHFIEPKDNAALKTFMENCTAQDEQLKNLCGIVLVSDDVEQVIEAALTLNSDWVDAALEAAIESRNIDDIRKLVRNTWIAPDIKIYLQMAQAMIRGMRDDLSVQNQETKNIYWTEIRFLTAEDFSIRLQGKLSVEWIKQKIMFRPAASEKAIEIKAWLGEWLDKHKDNAQTLGNFVQTLTGARALISPITFIIRPGVASLYPHTCSSDVDVPGNIDKDTLLAILDDFGNGKDLAFTRM